MLTNIEEYANPEEVDFELFCRVVAIYLELTNNPRLFNNSESQQQQNPEYREEEDEFVEEDEEAY